MRKYSFFWEMRKVLSMALLISMLGSLIQPFSVDAAVTDGAWNFLSWANNGYVNLVNSGAYWVGFTLSGTLNPSDTVSITARDGSGNTATGSFVSATGWESAGSLFLNMGTGFREGTISLSGIVYSGGISSQVVASGMTFMGVSDFTPPTITLSSAAPSTISGAITVNANTSETSSGFTLNDLVVTNGTASGLTQTGGTGYTFTVTPSVSSGTMSLSVGSGTFSDLAGNPNTGISNVLTFNVNGTGASSGTGTSSWTGTGTSQPVITISSHADNAVVSGFPTLSGTVASSGSIASVSVNGLPATLWSGIWSKTIYDLAWGLSTVTVVATNTAGNTGSASIRLNRVPLPYNTNVELSGTTSALVTFFTDTSGTGVVKFGTGISSLNTTLTGTTSTGSHRFTLTSLSSDTVYYFSVQWQGGNPSSTMHFKTPTIIDTATASGSITATSSVYLSGVTASGITFTTSGSLGILSLTSSGSSISIPLSGLRITSSGGIWDGVLQAPEVTSDPANLSLSGYAFTGTFYQIGSANSELFFSGQSATVTVNVGSSLSGQTVRVFRSPNRGVTYTELSSCVVTSGGNCTFTTNQLSRFAFASPADVVPNSFSFSGVTNAEFSTLYVSNPVTMSGIAWQSPISVTGGEYSINNAPFTALTGAVNSGDSVIVRVLSSASPSTSTSATLTVGGVSGTFTVTTKTATGGTGTGSTGGTTTTTGGGGGGGSILTVDQCPGGDFSPSYYDRTCGSSTGGTGGMVTPTNTGNVSTGVTTGTGVAFNIPPVIINSLGDIRFTDIGNNWAQFYIIRMVVRGIVDNVENYRPDDSLTRAEFVKIVINSAGWTLPADAWTLPFDDVSSDIWYAPYVSLALSKGMITSANASFRPNDPISRAEATKILVTALWIPGTHPAMPSFTDLDPTSDLTQYIEAAKSLNILSGQIIDGEPRFRPNDAITRAEIAKVVVKAFKL